MLQRRVGCSCSTGATPIVPDPCSGMKPHGADLTGEILDSRGTLADVPEVELHSDEVGERDPVDDDPRRARGAAMLLVPLEPEEDVVATPRPIVAVVAERQAEARRVLAPDERGAVDRRGRLLEGGGDLLDRRLREHARLPGGHHLLGSALLL